MKYTRDDGRPIYKQAITGIFKGLKCVISIAVFGALGVAPITAALYSFGWLVVLMRTGVFIGMFTVGATICYGLFVLCEWASEEAS